MCPPQPSASKPGPEAQPRGADRRRGLRRDRRRDRAAPPRDHGRHDPRERARPRRHLVLQQLPGRGLRRARATSTRSPSPSGATGRACARRRRRSTTTCTRSRAPTASTAGATRTRPSPRARGTSALPLDGRRPPRASATRPTRWSSPPGSCTSRSVPAIEGAERVRRPQLPLRRMGPRLPARGQARGRRRHRRERRPVRARDRPRGRRLTVFQRTGNWFLPRKNRPYPALVEGGHRTGARACRSSGAGSSSSTASR